MLILPLPSVWTDDRNDPMFGENMQPSTLLSGTFTLNWTDGAEFICFLRCSRLGENKDFRWTSCSCVFFCFVFFLNHNLLTTPLLLFFYCNHLHILPFGCFRCSSTSGRFSKCTRDLISGKRWRVAIQPVCAPAPGLRAASESEN